VTPQASRYGAISAATCAGKEHALAQHATRQRIDQDVERGPSDIEETKGFRGHEYRLAGITPLRRFVLVSADDEDRNPQYVQVRVDELLTTVTVRFDRHDEGHPVNGTVASTPRDQRPLSASGAARTRGRSNDRALGSDVTGFDDEFDRASVAAPTTGHRVNTLRDDLGFFDRQITANGEVVEGSNLDVVSTTSNLVRFPQAVHR